jgi:hypothetical protein
MVECNLPKVKAAGSTPVSRLIPTFFIYISNYPYDPEFLIKLIHRSR